MELHARIELFGGPEDGREIIIPTDSDGAPVTPLPIPSPCGGDPAEDIAMYERSHQRPSGQWIYRHAIRHPLGHPLR